MKTNLRPCPFCGKKRHLRFEPFEGSTDTGIVACVCGASYTTIEQGADWNTRPIEDGLQAEIEKLKAVLMDIWHITKEELDEENAILETRGDYMRRLERNINRIETITRKELDKECGQ